MSSSSLPPSKTPVDHWEEQLKLLGDQLRASGLTVTTVERSDGGDYMASIPQGRRPKSDAGGADHNRHRRHAKPGHAATIMVEWGYETHELTLTPQQWSSVMSGDELGLEGPGYFYDGKHFQDYWTCEGGYEGRLVVSYGDDGGVGLDFLLRNAIIKEFLPNGEPVAATTENPMDDSGPTTAEIERAVQALNERFHGKSQP